MLIRAFRIIFSIICPPPLPPRVLLNLSINKFFLKYFALTPPPPDDSRVFSKKKTLKYFFLGQMNESTIYSTKKKINHRKDGHFL